MKRRVLILAFVVLALAALAITGSSILAEPDAPTGYSITWYTMDSGGGTSSGGGYSLSGTIGQVDAGTTLSGGGYTLTGGFWAAPLSFNIGGFKVYVPFVTRNYP